MYTTLAEVSIGDLATFISVFATRGAGMRRKHGSHGAEVLGAAEDPNRVYVLIDWESREHFERFRADPDVPPTMKSGGATAPPRFTPLTRVGSFPA
ncbi:antibiotic biosynthesis monooxygenase family protein [Desertibaculum subflavum]|uniref:antibiotic biosynthesis monooxygenase family protein n=1 Tax=Desertibaculum subflavum TaxID=2268458 RepID=UPI0013C49FEC